MCVKSQQCQYSGRWAASYPSCSVFVHLVHLSSLRVGITCCVIIQPLYLCVLLVSVCVKSILYRLLLANISCTFSFRIKLITRMRTFRRVCVELAREVLWLCSSLPGDQDVVADL